MSKKRKSNQINRIEKENFKKFPHFNSVSRFQFKVDRYQSIVHSLKAFFLSTVDNKIFAHILNSPRGEEILYLFFPYDLLSPS